MVFEYRGNARTPGPLGRVPGALGGRVPGPLRSEPKGEPGKGSTATKASKTTPDQADGTSDALNEKVAKAAEGYVGKPVVGSGECYDLADAIAKEAGAKSAPDFGKVTKSKSQDYVWGKPVKLSEIKRGDQVQFRNHKIVIDITTTVTKDGKVIEESPKPSHEEHVRGQHSATVLSVNADGTFTVVEQHVLDPTGKQLSDTVRGTNTVYPKNKTTEDIQTRSENGHKIVKTTRKTITVTGKI